MIQTRKKPSVRIAALVVISVVVLLLFLLLPTLNTGEVTLFVFVVLGCVAVSSAFLSKRLSLNSTEISSRQWWTEFLQGVSTEMVGAIITGILFTVIVGAAEQRQTELRLVDEQQHAEEQLRTTLISETGSRVNDVAVRAAERLRERGWLTDGTLIDVFLPAANLAYADLEGANLQESNLSHANLQNAKLTSAILQNADLWATDFGGADLSNANLSGADLNGSLITNASLRGANLENANLRCADLRGADLRAASMLGAQINIEYPNGYIPPVESTTSENLSPLERIRPTPMLYLCRIRNTGGFTSNNFDTTTLMPDGTYWSLETDLLRFLVSDHPEFYQAPIDDVPGG